MAKYKANANRDKLKYSFGQVDFILCSYWLLKAGQLPFDRGVLTKGKGGKSPHETAMVWISDIDTALSQLDQKHPDRWTKLCSDVTIAKLDKIVRFLSHWQQAIVRYYLLIGDGCKEDEGRDARIAVKMMVRYLNKEV